MPNRPAICFCYLNIISALVISSHYWWKKVTTSCSQNSTRHGCTFERRPNNSLQLCRFWKRQPSPRRGGSDSMTRILFSQRKKNFHSLFICFCDERNMTVILLAYVCTYTVISFSHILVLRSCLDSKMYFISHTIQYYTFMRHLNYIDIFIKWYQFIQNIISNL